MKLAREFRRPDWRQMLAGMTSSELSEWGSFYRRQFFENDLQDVHFSRLSHLIISLMCKGTELTPASFSLLNPPAVVKEQDGDTMMSVAESVSGGVRYGPVSG